MQLKNLIFKTNRNIKMICLKCKDRGYTESTPLDEFSFRYWVRYEKTACNCPAGVEWRKK